MTRLKLTLSYEGTAYSGWQIQQKASPPPTIQGAVETALFTLTGEKIRVHGAGRTDAGVHALAQVAHCDVPDRVWDWRKRLNAVLPADIRISEACKAHADFDARKDARSKTYCYQFLQDSACVPPMVRNFAWAPGSLDWEEIRSRLSLLAGRHSFASFQNSGTDVVTTVREITDIRLIEADDLLAGPVLRLIITGDGFLKQMVRNIAGFLAAIGAGKLCWSELESILEAQDRRALPSATAPAKGLFLVKVNYGLSL